MTDIITLQILAQVEYNDIVKTYFYLDFKLRIILIDDSYIDVIVSQKIKDKFSFHCDTSDNSGRIFRYDNFPDINWKNVDTFPYHFHCGSQENVITSPFPKKLDDGFRSFMNYVKEQLFFNIK